MTRLLHCGDVTTAGIVQLFAGWDVTFVLGNMDGGNQSPEGVLFYAAVYDVALMREVVGEDMGVKAAGGIHTADEVREMVTAGATRRPLQLVAADAHGLGPLASTLVVAVAVVGRQLGTRQAPSHLGNVGEERPDILDRAVDGELLGDLHNGLLGASSS